MISIREGRWLLSNLWSDQRRTQGGQTLHVLVASRYSQCRHLPDIRTHVCCTLLDGEHDDAPNHRNLDPTENPECHRTNERIAVREVLLEGVDGQQRKIRLLFRIFQEVDVHELPDLEVMGCDVLDDLSKVLGDVAAFRDELLNVSFISTIATEWHLQLLAASWHPASRDRC